MTLKNKSIQGGATYETPSVKMLDILSEGLLCQSGDLTIKDWERDEDGLDF